METIDYTALGSFKMENGFIPHTVTINYFKFRA
jgi:hypothetical protein